MMSVSTSLRQGWRPARGLARALVGVILCGLCSCAGFWDRVDPFKPNIPTDIETESLVLGSDGLAAEKQSKLAMPEQANNALVAARELFRKEEYDKAEPLFGYVADREKNPPTAIQEAMYYKAECLRLQGYYPKAADVYSGLLNKFPNTQYREQCVQRMFDIANFWLDDTRKEMRDEKEKDEGKRWYVGGHFVNWEKSKPLLDEKGRAIEKLEQVRLHDLNGPLADQALWMCGIVKMYDENYRDADTYFSQIPARHPESPLAPMALEYAIFCKHMSTGGSDYDGRKTAEARKLVQTAFRSYPTLANDPQKREYLEKQVKFIDLQQAEKDYKIAEFYRRTGHPGSAYFYYQLVRQRYPDTKYARMAEEGWNTLRDKLLAKQGESAPPPNPEPNKPGWSGGTVTPPGMAGSGWQPFPSILPAPGQAPSVLPAPWQIPGGTPPGANGPGLPAPGATAPGSPMPGGVQR
jgi:outer membrane protein assembly factor BamD (BamD/ComL family)